MGEATVPQKRAYARRMAPLERREQLLDATLRVIVTQGVHKVSIDGVAKEAGIAKPLVYKHFEDSDALLRASLRREEEGVLVQLVSVLPRRTDGSPAEAVVAAVERFIAAVEAERERWLAAFSLVDSSTPAFRHRVQGAQRLMIAAFEDLVRWAIEDGLDPSTDVEMLARALFVDFWGAGKLALAEPETFPAERIVAFWRHSSALYLQPTR